MGSTPPNATSLKTNIGCVKYIEGDFEGALEVYNEALQLRRMLSGNTTLTNCCDG